MARHYASTRMPTSPAELGEALGDPERFRECFPNHDSRAYDDFAEAYAASSPRIAARIAEAEQVAVAKALKSPNGAGRATPVPLGADPGRPAGRGRVELYNKKAPGAKLDHLFASSARDEMGVDFLRAVWHQNLEPSAIDLRNKLAVYNAISERVPGQGGFLVPEVLRSDILQMMIEKSIIRQRARIVPMDSLRIPYPTIDDSSHVSSVLGGVTAFWAEEAAALTQSQPSFARTVLEAHKLTLYTEVANEVLHDSAQALAEWMQDVLPSAVAFYEDLAFITGTGTGQPQGILNAPAALQVNRATSSKVQFVDLAQMYCQLLPQSHRSPSTVWLCSPDVLPQLLQLAVTDPKAGTASIAPPVWLGGMSAAGDRPTSILGHDLYVTEKCPALGTTGDVILADLAFYLLGDRQELTASSSEHFKFSSDITAFRWIERVDGRLWLQSALTLENGSANKVSPVVVLH